MFRVKDFLMMEVISVTGDKIGFIKDITINFHLGIVTGFNISRYNLFKKNVNIFCEDIVSFNKVMIVKKVCKDTKLSFKNFKDMDVIDYCANMVGMLEDIIFDNNFKIKGVLISTGIFRKLYKGKKVALISEIMVGEENILYIKKNINYSFVSTPHSLMSVNCYDELL